jgi:methionyl-tRNA formyltransferase
MKVLFLTNNAVSEPLITWLRERETVRVCEVQLSTGELEAFMPELIVSYSYRHIVRQDVLQMLPGGFINLHISLLPFNRGADPNAWSCLDGTPAGVTIHQMDEGIDTGAILLQQEVAIDHDVETLASSYRILHNAMQTLFMSHWDDLRASKISPREQQGEGTLHRASEFACIRESLLGTQGWDIPISLLKQRYLGQRDAI